MLFRELICLFSDFNGFIIMIHTPLCSLYEIREVALHRNIVYPFFQIFKKIFLIGAFYKQQWAM